MLTRTIISALSVLSVGLVPSARAQKNISTERMLATKDYMKHHLWNSTTQNFVRRAADERSSADQPDAMGSDAWGITIVLDANAYMVERGLMKPEELKNYFYSSSS